VPSRGAPATTGCFRRAGWLLQEAAFAEWATETAARYQLSALEALGTLAEALVEMPSLTREITSNVPGSPSGDAVICGAMTR